jgi:cupin 2 domain-containing protein
MDKPELRNLFAGLPSQALAEEQVTVLFAQPGLRIERIVSTGQTTPQGEWYNQETEEWVLLVSGRARLRVEGEASDRALAPGDFMLLPAHCRHRVTWTDESEPTVWLAVHFGSG